MIKNINLLMGASTVALFSIAVMQGCGSDATSGGTTPGAGAPGAGAPGAGAPGAGAPGAGAPGAGAPGAGAPGAGAPGAGGAVTGGGPGAGAGGGTTAGAGGASGGAGGAAGAGGAKGGAGGAGGTSGGAAGAGGGSAGAGGAPSAACTTFCNDEETICTFIGANAAYTSKPDCLSTCATFTPGSGMTGNTLACRQYHVTNASKGADAAAIATSKQTHCPHTAKVSHNYMSNVTATDGPCN